MAALTPLEDIPDKYVGDPQEGLAEIVRWFGQGRTAVTRARDANVYVTTVSGGGVYCSVEYIAPEELGNWSTGAFDAAKKAAIQEWLHALTNRVREYRGEPTLAFAERNRASTIRETLASAAAKPVAVEPQHSTPVDAFVARVLARRGGTPS